MFIFLLYNLSLFPQPVSFANAASNSFIVGPTAL